MLAILYLLLQWIMMTQIIQVLAGLPPKPTEDSVYGLPVLYPYGNCSREMGPQTLNFYFTHTLPDLHDYKMYSLVNQRKASVVVEQPDSMFLVTNLSIIPMLLTDERATSYNQCLGFYCYEEASNNNKTCTYRQKLSGMSIHTLPVDPTILLSAVYQEPDFVKVIPLVPITSRETKEVVVYTYYVLFGNSFPKLIFNVPSIGLMRENSGKINVTLKSVPLINRNSKTLPTNSSWLSLDMDNWDVVWIQNNWEEMITQSSSPKITSEEPVAVFAGMARENHTRFSYIHMHMYQMPDTQKWGKEFVVDLTHVNMLLHEQNIIATFKILTTNSSFVTVTMYPRVNSQRLQLEAEEPKSLILPSITDKSFPTHVLIQGSEKLLILYEVYKSNSEGNANIFSLLLQPTEWYTYKQTAILVATLDTNTPSQNNIAVVSLKDALVEVQTNTSTPVAIKDYEYFEQVKSVDVSKYTIHQIRVKTNAVLENNSLVFTSKDFNGCQNKLGATLFSYSQKSSYAHTNPPVFNDSITNNISDTCKRNVDQTTVIMIASSTGVTLLLVLVLVVVTIAIVVLTKPRILFQKPDPPPEDFEYDIFLSFADRDKDLVKNILYSPLRKCGYKVFWHFSDFIAGLTIAENMLTAIRKSRWIIFVCSKHFEQSEFCQQELRFGLNSHYSTYKGRHRRVIPLVLEEKSCPLKLKQLYPIEFISKSDQDRPQRKCIKDLIRRLHLGKPLSVLKGQCIQGESGRTSTGVVTEDRTGLLINSDA